MRLTPRLKAEGHRALLRENDKLHKSNQRMRSLLKEAGEALEKIKSDWDERVRLYGEQERQPARVRVMEQAGVVLAKLRAAGVLKEGE